MGALRLCFLLFCLLVKASSVRKLNDITLLKNTAYGRAAPRHGILLLFWFAQNVIIEEINDALNVDFNPLAGAYGFHQFRNIERLLPSMPSYYSVGNLNYHHADLLPEYVQRYRYVEEPENNMDRIMISLDNNNPNEISRVFLTAHNRYRNDFNISDTYEIDPALILQIRQTYCDVSIPEDQRCLQFLQWIGYDSNYCGKPPKNERSSDSQCNTYEEINLEIKTTTQGYTKLIWGNIPADLMKQYRSVYIAICQTTSDTNKDCTVMEELKITESSGALDTSVSLNAGLQPRLQLNYFYSKEDIWYGPEFDGANGVIPTTIKGFDASLQLYAADGKACARLYIKKTFSNWKDVLYHSWIGFYNSSQDKNDGYYTFQYAVDFEKIDNNDIYDIYQYNSSLGIAPKVQIRFFKDKEYNKVLAQTTPWEDDEKVTSTCDNPLPELSSSWPYPDLFYEPEFCNAKNPTPVKKQTYDAGLQLFTKDSKACARLYIKTADNCNKKDFNVSDTYEFNPALILQIRHTYCNNVCTPEDERCLQFLQQIGYNHQNKRSSDSQCNAYEEIKLEIKTTAQGYSKLKWWNIPADLMKQYSSVYIAIRHTSDTCKDCKVIKQFKITESSGAIDTSVSLNAGLQPILRVNYFSSKEEIWYGPEFDGANVIPIRIKGLDTSLQLYAKDGKACARLYIKKTFSNWKDVLHNSWIGFYKSSQDKNDGYYTYQYAVYFEKIDNNEIYNIYQYKSSLTIAPGVQIRFLMDKQYNKVLAQTTPWEGVETVTSTCDNPLPDRSSSWPYPEFFYQPELYDANNVLPIKIPMYDAGLQLFTKDGKACARLYIDKTFTDWKKTFNYSWVGFYTSSQNANKKYNKYQYAVYFEKTADGTNKFDVYQYKSNLAIAPGVQIRFLKDKGYNNKLVETEAWY